MSNNRSRFSFRCGLFHGSRKIWNCLALHWAVDDAKKTIGFTFGIPKIITLVATLPTLPKWMGSSLIAGGPGEYAEYGFWHDYHETKLQWRRIINLGSIRRGWEKRIIHCHQSRERIEKIDTMLTSMVSDSPQVAHWKKTEGIVSWWFAISTWHGPSTKPWIPSLYDHFFILHATRFDCSVKEVSLKQNITRELIPLEVFIQLSERLHYT